LGRGERLRYAFRSLFPADGCWCDEVCEDVVWGVAGF